jgi:hypothetical protein
MTLAQFNRTCNVCGNFRPQLGGAIRFTGGIRQWVCAGCKVVIDKAKEYPL